jgi:hypothetical protein
MILAEIKKRLRRLDLLDWSMIKILWIIFGIILATYISSLRGFIEQNILVVIFLMIIVGIKPVINFFKK